MVNDTPTPAPKHSFGFLSERVSALTSLALSLLLGFAFVYWIRGPRVINPFDTSWIGGDIAQAQHGFAFMRRSQSWVFPPTWVDGLAYPKGVSAAYLDVIPPFAVPFKFLGAWLPEQFQYFGIFAVLCAGLQFHFGRILASRVMAGNWAGLVGGFFFLLSPPFIWRDTYNPALSAHWILLAALCALAPGTLRRPTLSLLALNALAGSVHPYLAAMTMLVSGFSILPGAAHALRNSDLRGAFIAACRGTAFAMAALAGLIASGFIVLGAGPDIVANGYTAAGLDLLSPIDPGQFKSLLLPSWPVGPYQYEGYNYLGLGMLLLLGIGFVQRVRGRHAADTALDAELWLGLALTCAALAASTHVTLGGRTIFNPQLPEWAMNALSTLRASGRLFWPGYYALYVLTFAGLRLAGLARIAALSVALGVQVADTASLRDAMREVAIKASPASLLHDPIWQAVPHSESHLSLVPALACGDDAPPGGFDATEAFGNYAVSHKLTIDSFLVARTSVKWADYICAQPAYIKEHGLAPDTAYVFSRTLLPMLVDMDGRHRLAGKGCTVADGFILCSSATGYGGLDPKLVDLVFVALDSARIAFNGTYASTPASEQNVALRGFDAPTHDGVFTNSRNPIMVFRLTKSVHSGHSITLTLSPCLPGKAAHQPLSITANGRMLVQTTVSSLHSTITIPLPPDVIDSAGLVTLSMSLPNATSPFDAGVGWNRHPYGLVIEGLSIQPINHEGGQAAP